MPIRFPLLPPAPLLCPPCPLYRHPCPLCSPLWPLCAPPPPQKALAPPFRGLGAPMYIIPSCQGGSGVHVISSGGFNGSERLLKFLVIKGLWLI